MTLTFRRAQPELDAAVCYALMRQLRPHLAGETEFREQWLRQQTAGYRLLGAWQDDRLVGLAGYRTLENLVHGFHLYVDDLVTAEEVRQRGIGAELLARVRVEARALGCAKLLLDTPMANTLAHRFYYRQGLVATALRFLQPITPAG